MNHQNEKVLRTSYDAFGRGNANPLMTALAEDIKWYVSGRSPLTGEYSGKAEVLGFFGKMMEVYQERRANITEKASSFVQSTCGRSTTES